MDVLLFFTCAGNDHPALGIQPYPHMLRRVGTDGVAVVIQSPEVPVAIPGIVFQSLFLLADTGGKASGSFLVSPKKRKLGKLA